MARAAGRQQTARIRDQTAGRVGWFFNTEAFDRDYERMRQAGVVFEEARRHEPYGTVAIFRDLYGNRWDLIQPHRAKPADVPDDTTSPAGGRSWIRPPPQRESPSIRTPGLTDPGMSVEHRA